jgi:hypothetical protein
MFKYELNQNVTYNDKPYLVVGRAEYLNADCDYEREIEYQITDLELEEKTEEDESFWVNESDVTEFIKSKAA